jgi:DNA-binding MarR family transcriptional regulator
MPRARPSGVRPRAVSDRDYSRLLTIRTALRQFERWSAAQAAALGVTASQHQLMLAIRGHDPVLGPTISQIADYLLIRHHSAVELADRSERAGLVRRVGDPDDHRVVRLELSSAGEQILADLSSSHLEELARLGPLLRGLLDTLAIR